MLLLSKDLTLLHNEGHVFTVSEELKIFHAKIKVSGRTSRKHNFNNFLKESITIGKSY